MKALAGALPSLLLRLLLTSTPEALGANPGLVARITDKGLEYVASEGLVTLQEELLRITLPGFTGKFKIKPFGRGSYLFHSPKIHSCKLLSSALTPLPGQGLSLTISDSFIRAQSEWKARKLVKLQGSLDVDVKGITISVNLVLGSEPSGRPTINASSCSSHIKDVEVYVSGDLGWLLNIFHDQIESKFRRVLESKICEMIQKSVASDLQPYLQTLPVTTEIDSFAGVDYRLMEAPRATAQMLEVMFKGEIFNRDHYSPVTFLAPVMSLPEEHSRMVYFAVSDYVFNTASQVYHEAGYLNFTITDDMVPFGSSIRLTTKSFRPFAPRLARLYPNMNLELQGAMASAPFLNLSPGNLSLAPQMEIEGFVLLPSSVREPVFRLGVATNVSATLTFNTSRITGALKPGKVQVELKESKVGVFNVELLEGLLNYLILSTLYPKVNEKLAEGFPLPLLKHIQLYEPVLEIHKDFVFLGANVQYMRV
ncbi:lipopolysaccharide-binding protein isoform X1 [Suricata suricatta]|uniref:Lipopolysaccharide-binding protein n=1 Tax=Suricata suricatta TaxID=37032 RepID=A0A673UKT7_SURSU|nr:lipopolysaccharide-binding protein isoform X1 [Suricata suricatta]